VRVLILSSEFPPGPGGIGTHAYQLAMQLFRLGWSPVVLTAQDYLSGDEIAEFNRRQPFPIETFRRPPSTLLKAAYRYHQTRRWLLDARPDVIVASGQRSVWVAAATLRNHDMPWVAIGHGAEFGCRRGWERKLVVSAFNRASAVVCVSRYTQQLMNDCGVRPKNSYVIPNGADQDTFVTLSAPAVERSRREMGFGEDRVLLTVGNVTERKGQEVVIRALPRILEHCPNVRYFMAGLPTERVRLTTIAKELGVEGRVHFLGRVTPANLVSLLNCCDLFLMTSRKTGTGDCEGYGIAAVEAALCGKTSVVSAESGLAEAVLHQQTGLCVPSGKSDAVADAVVTLLTNDRLRIQLETAARQRALKEQTWALRGAEYDRLLRSLTEPKSALIA